MPDDIDLSVDDQGPEDAGTVEPGADLDLSDDQGAEDSVQSDEGDGGYPFDPIDEATESLLHTDPSRGLQILRERLLKEQKQRDKRFTKQMTRLKEEMKGAAGIKEKWDILDRKFTEIQQKNPDLYTRFVEAMTGNKPGTSGGNEKKLPSFSSREEFAEWLDGKFSSFEERLYGRYVGDQISKEVDTFIKKYPAFRGERDDIIRLRSSNPDLSMTQAAAASNPKLFTSIVSRRQQPAPEFGVNERTAPSRNRHTSLEDCIEGAFQKHGDPDRAPPG